MNRREKYLQNKRSHDEPEVGLALGGRAARGLAHLGLLKVLEDAKIPLQLITSTSLGGGFIRAIRAIRVEKNSCFISG